MTIQAEHFQWHQDGDVGLVTLNRPERKNPLTFESYAELRDTFRALVGDDSVRAIVISGQGGNFCSGGDVHEIIGPLTKMNMNGLLDFTRMTGDLIKAIRGCPQPVIAAIDGVCVWGQALQSPWLPICVLVPYRVRRHFYSPVLVWLAVIWVLVRCYRGS